jgi:hypothetical protein
MKTLQILKEHLDAAGFYTGAELDVRFEGHLEIAGGLGWVRFKKSISVTGNIVALVGSGIKAGEGIEAGSGIEAGEGIEAGSGIEAGEGIKAGWGIKAGEGIEAGWGIKAGEGIEAGSGIEAGWGIEAGSGIEAGWGIEAGSGIEAGLSVACRAVLSVKLRLFAGTCIWKVPEPAEMEVRCKRFEGTLAFGILVEEKESK